jgi:hypothetical protein
MNKDAKAIIDSIMEEFAACRQKNEELEAKSLFRLLNYCPPELTEWPVSPNLGAARQT